MSGCDLDARDLRDDLLLPGVFETFIVADDDSSPFASFSSSKTLATYLSMARSHALLERVCSDDSIRFVLCPPGVDVGEDVMELPFPVLEVRSILTNLSLCSSGSDKSLNRSSHPEKMLLAFSLDNVMTIINIDSVYSLSLQSILRDN